MRVLALSLVFTLGFTFSIPCYGKTDEKNTVPKVTSEVKAAEKGAPSPKVKSETKMDTKKTKDEKWETTDSGLKFLKRKEGDKKSTAAKTGDIVDVHYTGWLYDEKKPDHKGKQFDSSLKRGMPITFQLGVGRVIQGWDEGLKGMLVGEERTLLIPPQLGYGERGAGRDIPPNATLLFEVKLEKVHTS